MKILRTVDGSQKSELAPLLVGGPPTRHATVTPKQALTIPVGTKVVVADHRSEWLCTLSKIDGANYVLEILEHCTFDKDRKRVPGAFEG